MKTFKTSVLHSSPVRLTALATAFLVASGLLLAPSSTRAQDVQDDAAFTCASAVNVMDCIKQTGTGAPKAADITAIPVNSQALGFTGPITAGIRYDNYLAWILDVGYAQEFGNGAAAFKLSAGLNERRANVTLGYAITPKQQIKLTYEYLAQNLPFDYASGKVNEWVNQNAFGGAYRYMLDYGIIRALEVYGTYTKASSKELSEVEMYTDDLLTAINYRRIAGGTEKTAGTSVTLTPFKNTIVKVGAGYSTLSFDTRWSDTSTTSALAYNAELAHLLTPTTLISTGIGNTASGRSHTARVSQILPWSLEASVIGQYTATTNDIPSSTSVTAQLSYPAPKTYTNMFAEGIGKLKDWVEKPVIYNTRVLAKAEERVVQVQIKTTPIPTTNIPVGANIPPIETKNYFNFNQEVFNKIDYKIVSVTNKSDNKPANTNLNLQTEVVDSFNAKVTSKAPATVDMMTPGDFMVTLQAQGYRNGAIVSKVDNAFETTVRANSDLNPPSLNAAGTLPAATTGSTDYYANLSPLVQNNNPGINDSYTFNLKEPIPQWIKLGDDGHSLVSSQAVPATPANVYLQVTSKASGQNSDTQKYVIAIQGNIVGPQWIPYASLPPAIVGDDYSSLAVNLNPYSPPSPAGAVAYLDPTTQSGSPIQDTVTFDVNSNCSWLKMPNKSTGLLTGEPTASGNCNVSIKVISSKLNNQPYTLDGTITVDAKGVFEPYWVPGYQAELEKIPYDSGTFTMNLEDAIRTTNSADPIKLFKRDTAAGWTCSWLDINSENMLINTAPIPTTVITDCVINIKALNSTDQEKTLPQATIHMVPNLNIPFAPNPPNPPLPNGVYGKPYNEPINIVSNRVGEGVFIQLTSHEDCPNFTISPPNSKQLVHQGNLPVQLTKCNFTFKVISDFDSTNSTKDVTTSINIGPDTNIPFDATFVTLPAQASYGTSYAEQDLTSMIASTRPGEKLQGFTKDTSNWTCAWLTINDSKLVQINDPEESDITPCDISVNVQSTTNPNTDNKNVPATITIGPNTDAQFQPAFDNGQPKNAFYANSYHDETYTLDLTQVVHSNRKGETLNPTFTKTLDREEWTCDGLSLQADGKTVTGIESAPQNYTGNTTCKITVYATSATNTTATKVIGGTVTIKPNTTDAAFEPTAVGTLSNAVYGTNTYDVNLSPLIKSNRPGEPLATLFSINSTTCNNAAGTRWIRVNPSNNHLESTMPVPIIADVSSCDVTLNVQSGYDPYPTNTVTMTINLDKNASIAPKWDTVACPLTNNNAITNAYNGGKNTTFDLSKCIKNYLGSVPIEDTSLKVSDSSNGFATVSNNQLTAAPSISNLGQALNYTFTVNSQTYAAAKTVNQNLWVEYYIIPNTRGSYSDYGNTQSVYYYGNEFIRGVTYKQVNQTDNMYVEVYLCPFDPTKPGMQSVTSWNPDYTKHDTCYKKSENDFYNQFTPGSDGYVTIVFTSFAKSPLLQVSDIKIQKR